MEMSKLETSTDWEEHHTREMPRKMDNMMFNNKMRKIGSPGMIVKDTTIWTSSNRIKEGIDEDAQGEEECDTLWRSYMGR